MILQEASISPPITMESLAIAWISPLVVPQYNPVLVGVGEIIPFMLAGKVSSASNTSPFGYNSTTDLLPNKRYNLLKVGTCKDVKSKLCTASPFRLFSRITSTLKVPSSAFFGRGIENVSFI